MQKIKAVSGGLALDAGVAAGILLVGALFATSRYLAHPQTLAEAQAAETASASPLIGVNTSSQNPLQVSLLRRYNANLTT